jgi:hypothetical protein
MSRHRIALALAALGVLAALGSCNIDWENLPPTPPSDQSKFGP